MKVHLVEQDFVTSKDLLPYIAGANTDPKSEMLHGRCTVTVEDRQLRSTYTRHYLNHTLT
jgi:hypothetical protein